MLHKLICFMYLSSLRVASLLYTLLAYTVTLSWPDYYLRPVLTSRPRRRMVTWHFILPHSMDISGLLTCCWNTEPLQMPWPMWVTAFSFLLACQHALHFERSELRENASLFTCYLRVTTRDFPKWRACSQASFRPVVTLSLWMKIDEVKIWRNTAKGSVHIVLE